MSDDPIEVKLERAYEAFWCTQKRLTELRELLRLMIPLIARGLIEGAYTQTVGGDQYAKRILDRAELEAWNNERKPL